MPQTTPSKRPFMSVDPDNKLVKTLLWIGVGGVLLYMVILLFTGLVLKPFTSFNIFLHENLFFDTLPLIFVGSLLLIFVCIFLLRDGTEPDCCCQHHQCCHHRIRFEEHSTLHEESSTARFERLGIWRDYYR